MTVGGMGFIPERLLIIIYYYGSAFLAKKLSCTSSFLARYCQPQRMHHRKNRALNKVGGHYSVTRGER